MAALTQANLGGRTIELTQMTTLKTNLRFHLCSVHVHDAFDLMTLKNNVLFPNVKPQTVRHAIF